MEKTTSRCVGKSLANDLDVVELGRVIVLDQDKADITRQAAGDLYRASIDCLCCLIWVPKISDNEIITEFCGRNKGNNFDLGSFLEPAHVRPTSMMFFVDF